VVFIKRVVFWGALACVVYTLTSFHFIFIDKSIKLLRKSSFTLEYTFYSAAGKSNGSILAIEPLRRDGIADLLVEMNRMTMDEKEILMSRYED
jgi:hypothetical protein